MAKKVMALNNKGELTYCTVDPEMRGIGRCNHITHQKENESIETFVSRVNTVVNINDTNKEVIADQTIAINKIINENKTSFNVNPDWEDIIKNDIPNPFTIGKGETYEEAIINSVSETPKLNDNGDPVIALEAEIEFRDEKHLVDLGEIPDVQDDGSIIINGSAMRVLPVLAQNKSGLIRYRTKSVIRTNDGHVAFTHEPGSDIIKVKGKEVDIEELGRYFKEDPNDPPNITANQIKDLNKIDNTVFMRYPDFKDSYKDILNDHTPDQANDLDWRKVYTYADQVRFEIAPQMRRMGVTFRTNLNAKYKAGLSGDKDKIEAADKLPLFYQKNNTENILSNLTGRSNVQVADNLNPLAALSQARKISLTGPGGFNKDKAPTILRQVGESHRNKIDSLDLSSGKNIGLTITLSNADVNKNGFIETSNNPAMTVSDFIPYKKHNDINRAAMATAHMKQAVPITGGEDPRLLGDSSDSAWNKISGSKIGTNLNVAYYASEGTHEDAVVISESAAKKMMTKQDLSYRIENENIGKIRVGDYLNREDIVAGNKIRYRGVVKSIDNGKMTVESEFKMGPGDKIAGRHGNKGVVSKVIPDSKMPKIDKGNGKFEPAEILMSPLGVVGRMNIGQIYETNSGQLNKKTKMQLPNGRKVDSTSGEQYIMRLNHIAEKKLQYYSNEVGSDRDSVGLRLGEMESLILSPTEERRAVLNYLRNQEGSDAINKLDSLLKSIGVSYNMKSKQ